VCVRDAVRESKPCVRRSLSFRMRLEECLLFCVFDKESESQLLLNTDKTHKSI